MWVVSVVIFLIYLIYIVDSKKPLCQNEHGRNIYTEYKKKSLLNLKNCGNTEIDIRDVNGRSSLNYVLATDNKISEITDKSFEGATDLIEINLNNNTIKKISVDAFREQIKLQHLYLKENQLTRIEVGIFDSLVTMDDLWIQNNQITLIEKGLFDRNTKLKTLLMDSNKIIAIEPTAFRNLTNISTFTISKNLCSAADKDFKELNPNFNCFTNFEFFKPHLDEISKSRSEVEDLKKNLTETFKNLTETAEKSTEQIFNDCECKTESPESRSETEESEGNNVVIDSKFGVGDIQEKMVETLNLNEAILTYILIGVVATESLVILIFLLKCKGSHGKNDSNNSESHPGQIHYNDNHLIYAELDLKPSNRIPIRTDEVIYSQVM